MTADVGREVEAVDLSALEFDPPCEYSSHERCGTGAAVWAVLTKATCAHHRGGWLMFCDGCWTTLCHPRNDIYRCHACGHVTPARSHIVSVERIRPPSSP